MPAANFVVDDVHANSLIIGGVLNFAIVIVLNEATMNCINNKHAPCVFSYNVQFYFNISSCRISVEYSSLVHYSFFRVCIIFGYIFVDSDYSNCMQLLLRSTLRLH